MSVVPNIRLNQGIDIPQFGLGVWQVSAEETTRVVEYALEVGYRHIDTAALYGNETEVGKAIRNSGIAREEIFITTKLWNDAHRHDDALAAADESLAKLGMDYVDLYLIHWPCPSEHLQVEAWQALIEVQQAGKARAIGVSNFREEDLTLILDATGVVPAVNQIELHPTFQQAELRKVNASHGIATEVWSPLGVGADLTIPTITGIADRVGVTPAQVILRWHIQLGNIVFPKSVTPSRIAENFDIFGFELTDADMAAIAACDTGTRHGWDPANG